MKESKSQPQSAQTPTPSVNNIHLNLLGISLQ